MKTRVHSFANKINFRIMAFVFDLALQQTEAESNSTGKNYTKYFVTTIATFSN